MKTTSWIAVVLVGLTVSAWASGGGHQKGNTAAAKIAGRIISATNDSQGNLASFVLETHEKQSVTISVTTSTKYKLDKAAATSVVVKADVKAAVGLAAAIANGAGTAVDVNVNSAAAGKPSK
jgi:hypothetical protein